MFTLSTKEQINAFLEALKQRGDIYGAGDATLIVNDRFVELGGIGDSIVLNSVMQEACQGEALQNEKMDGDFPLLKPGNDRIRWSGDITRMVIAQNRWNL